MKLSQVSSLAQYKISRAPQSAQIQNKSWEPASVTQKSKPKANKKTELKNSKILVTNCRATKQQQQQQIRDKVS